MKDKISEIDIALMTDGHNLYKTADNPGIFVLSGIVIAFGIAVYFIFF